MANFKTGWMKKLIDGVSEKIFAIAHVKTVYYDYANKKTLSDKLNEIDKKIDESVTKDAVTDALGYTPYTPNEIDNKFSTLETNIDWKEAVATYDDIATTYPNPEDGWTVNVKDTDYTYRYNGTDWVAISANAIPKSTSSVDGLMSSSDKSKLDGIAANANNYVHPSYTAKSSGLWKIVVDAAGHVSDTTAVTKSDITGLGIPESDTKNTAGSTDTSSKIFLIGAISQAANPQTYSQDTAYVGTDGCVYSGGKKTSVDGHKHTKSEITDFPSSLKNPNALSINGKSYDGSSAVNVGTIGASYGGTGQTSLTNSSNALINALSTGSDTPVDADYYVSQYVNGGSKTTTYHRRPMSALWNYIKSKLSTVATTGSYSDLKNKPNYAGSSSAGGAATTALACTGNSATATKATQDGNGNVITNTYVPKSGNSAVSGAITFGDSDSYGIRTSKDNYGCIGQSGKAFYQSYINSMYGTLRGAIGVSSLFTREFNFSVSAIAGGSDSPQALNFTTPTDCTALGIVGKYMSGNYYTYLVFTSEYVSGNFIQTMIHNSGSTTTGTINITYIILFCKRS